MSIESAYEAEFLELERIVRRFFPVAESYIEFGVPTFIIEEGAETKKSFVKLYWVLRSRNRIPVLRRIGGRIVLKIASYTPKRRRSRIPLFLVFFLFTLASLLYSGWLQISNRAFDVVDPNRNIPINVALYVFCFMVIAGLHELGHKIACEFHGVKSSPPYFLPGPPNIGGTMGAIIIQESPVVNRDQLFDIGISGPILGFIATILVSILGLRLSYIIKHPIGTTIPVSPMFEYLASAFVNIPRGYVLLLHPVAFVGWVGFVLTFINTIPVAQLDGGHIARALFGAKYYRLVSYVGAAILFASGYYFMAIIALAMLAMRGHPGPLDDVSPLSLSRKIIGATVFPAILLLSMTVFAPWMP